MKRQKTDYRDRTGIWTAILDYARMEVAEGYAGVKVSSLAKHLGSSSLCLSHRYLDEAALLNAGYWADSSRTVFIFYQETLGESEE